MGFHINFYNNGLVQGIRLLLQGGKFYIQLDDESGPQRYFKNIYKMNKNLNFKYYFLWMNNGKWRMENGHYWMKLNQVGKILWGILDNGRKLDPAIWREWRRAT